MSKTLYVRKSGQDSSLTTTTPGTVEFKLVSFLTGDPAYQKADGSGNLGMSIAQLRNLFGGDEGEIVDPFKQEVHPISLKPWTNADPDQTFLHFSFRFIPA